MASQAAVHDPSPERPSSSHSNLANGNEPNYPQTFTDHGGLHFAPAPPDASPHRASRQSFENHLATLQSPSRPDPSATTQLHHETSQSSQIAPIMGAIDERPLPDGLDPESNPNIHDPFPEQTASSALPAQPASPTSVYEGESLVPAPPPQPQSMTTLLDNAALQPTPIVAPLTSELFPSTQSTSLPAPIPAFDSQRATLIPQPHPYSAPHLSTASHPQTPQPVTPTNYPTHNHHTTSPRDRRRRRFARWVRRRFRRQLPWLEGWLHGREGSERREARRAIRAAEEAGFR